jgi:hypothetical protein
MTGCRQHKPRLGLAKCPDLVDHYKGIPKPMSILFVTDIGPLLIKFTDKCDIIEHDFLNGHLP